MLSDDYFYCLGKICSAGSLLGCIPYEWDAERRVLRFVKSSQWRWKLLLVIQCAYMAFSFARLLQNVYIADLPFHKCIIPAYYSIAHFHFAMIHLSYIWAGQEHAAFVTSFIEFDTHFAGTDKNGVERGKTGFILKLFCAMTVSHAFSQGLGFLIFPNSSNFIYSVFAGNPTFDSLYVRLTFAAFETLLVFMNWMANLLGVTGWLTFMEAVAMWNENIRLRGDGVWIGEKRIFFRSLQLLVRQYNDAYALITMPAQKVAVFCGAVVSSYGTINFVGKIHIMMYMLMPITVAIVIVFIFLFYHIAGSLHSTTLEALSAAKGNVLKDEKQTHSSPTTQLEQKSLLCIPELGIRVMDFYIITRETTFTYCSIIVSHTITLLLA